jgi:hypothetical protein
MRNIPLGIRNSQRQSLPAVAETKENTEHDQPYPCVCTPTRSTHLPPRYRLLHTSHSRPRASPANHPPPSEPHGAARRGTALRSQRPYPNTTPTPTLPALRRAAPNKTFLQSGAPLMRTSHVFATSYRRHLGTPVTTTSIHHQADPAASRIF